MTTKKTMTTNAGTPVAENQNVQTAGPHGPMLMQNVWYMEKLAHFTRERIPERVVHAKGSAAYGTFTVTKDITKYTKASIFSEVGKQTDLFVRFSTVAGERGAADTERDVRGFAIKFYTDEGNWDLVGNNTPVFFIRDPLKFPDFIHTQKRDPKTNLRSATAAWDFWSLSPETLHQVMILMSDRGIPASLRQMHGFGSHTFSFINAANERFWVKFHFKTQQGMLNSTCKCNRILINNLFKFFVWREVSKSFTRSIIEFIFNPLNLFVGYFTKVLTLWDILPDKPVGVFIGTTFP